MGLLLISFYEPFQLANQAHFYANVLSLQGQQTSDDLANIEFTNMIYKQIPDYRQNNDLLLKNDSTAELDLIVNQ